MLTAIRYSRVSKYFVCFNLVLSSTIFITFSSDVEEETAQTSRFCLRGNLIFGKCFPLMIPNI